MLSEFIEGGVDLILRSGRNDDKLPPDRLPSGVDIRQLRLDVGSVRVDQTPERAGRLDLMEQFQPFRVELRRESGGSSYVAAGGLNWRQARSTGSPPKVKTIGMVVVDFMAARMAARRRSRSALPPSGEPNRPPWSVSDHSGHLPSETP